MKTLFALTSCLASTALPLAACGAYDDRPAAEAYAAVEAKATETLTSIHKDLVALDETGKFAQLKGIKDAKIQRSEDLGTRLVLRHHKEVTQSDLDRSLLKIGGTYRFGKDGCAIGVELLTYDAKSDPRFSSGAMSCRVIPHFQVKATGAIFGLDFRVSAEETEAGNAFTTRVNAMIESRLEGMKKELGAVTADWGDLVDRREPLSPTELEKKAYIMIEGTVTAHSAELYEKTGKPQRVSVKVTKVLGGRNDYQARAKVAVGEVIPLDTWGLKPAIDIPIGATIKGYLNIGTQADARNGQGSYYYPIAVNGVQVMKK